MSVRTVRPFLVAATLHAALLLPLAVLTRYTPACIPGLIDLTAPAEEMLFGFAPAIAAGLMPGAAQRRGLTGLLVLWLLARALKLPDGPGALPALLSAGFIIVLAFEPLRRARIASGEARNYPVGAALLALGLSAAINDAGAGLHDHELRMQGLFMGLAAVIGLLLALMPPGWRPWQSADRADQHALRIGYAWLAVGALLLAMHLAGLGPVSTYGVQAITIGAVGTLGTALVLRQHAAAWVYAAPMLPLWTAALLSLAAVLRMTLGHLPGAMAITATVWIMAFGLCAFGCLRPKRH